VRFMLPRRSARPSPRSRREPQRSRARQPDRLGGPGGRLRAPVGAAGPTT
jgi:hypothetical protein